MSTLTIYFLTALAFSVVLTPICRLFAERLGCVAKPSEDRWHRRPTALFGGVAIVLTVVGVSLTIQPRGGFIWHLLSAGVLIAAFGFVDDLLHLKASTKLIAQIVVASLLLFFGYRLEWTQSMIGDAMLTLLWIVGITNAFNLLDNMDGLCAGTTIVAGLFLLIRLVADAGASSHALYLATVLGATAGFLVYNFHPASIFLGDTGSLFLGLNLAALTLLTKAEARGKAGLLSVVAAPVLLLLIPIFDTTLVTAMRLLSGRRPSQGGRDHTSHRLVAVGLSEPRAVTTLWLLAAVGGVISLLLQRRDVSMALLVALMFVLAMIIFAVYLARIRVYDEAELAAKKSDTLTPLVANFMYKRRVAEVMLDMCLIPAAYYMAYRLRFEGGLFATNYQFFIQSLPVVIAAQLLSLFIVGGYRGSWRLFGMMDAVVFVKGVLLGTVASLIAILYIYRFESYSRAVFVIDAALLFLLLSGSRASFRLVGEFILRRSTLGRRCIIYGTGGASLGTIREAFGAEVSLKIVGFIDDDPLHRSMRVSGYSVLGNHADLLSLIERGEVDCVVLNTPLLAAERLQELEQACEAREIDLLRLQVHLKRLSVAS
jgi:UDP-GlcNAc:undecaprenyl-phosphate/decaprenyl-phosphate GlcNAc-1-phosphate transferase